MIDFFIYFKSVSLLFILLFLKMFSKTVVKCANSIIHSNALHTITNFWKLGTWLKAMQTFNFFDLHKILIIWSVENEHSIISSGAKKVLLKELEFKTKQRRQYRGRTPRLNWWPHHMNQNLKTHICHIKSPVYIFTGLLTLVYITSHSLHFFL